MTDSAIIAASYAAERNYSHNPDDVIDTSNAVGAWGTAKESTTELSDLSGNNNIADIHGAMPTEGFIQGRRFDGDNLLISNPTVFETVTSFEIHCLFKLQTNVTTLICDKYDFTPKNGFRFVSAGTTIILFIIGNGVTSNLGSYTILDSKWNHVILKYTGDTILAFVNGVKQNVTSLDNIIAHTPDELFIIGSNSSGEQNFEGIISSSSFFYVDNTDECCHNIFNTLARLPFWSVNYTDYPDNTTEYTANLPYSSSIISSGTFKVDDDKLQCVSAGTMTYSASYEFDGSEYIKVTIGGVEYAGTGTITQGNTTVSVAQGSNKVTIVMGTGNMIDKVNIQFREEI